jgi:NADPH:quinone reductase-like Zn-dependent oxidoreductase
MRAIQITKFGRPLEVLELVEFPEPRAPAAGQVLVGVEFSPINMNDLYLIEGVFPIRPTLPSVAGNQGVGRVLAVGRDVHEVRVGDRVLVPLYAFSWRERMVLPAKGLFALPPEADPRQLSMLGINPPTAALLLREYVDLRPGDWVAQNAANSGVGHSVIAIAKSMGLRTINFVRRAELVTELKTTGGDVVVVDESGVLDKVRLAVGDGRVPLGIDGVSGGATATVAGALTQGGTVVTYAFMSGQSLTINPMDLIAKRVVAKGFFQNYPEFEPKIHAAVRESARLMASGAIHNPVAATYPLSSLREAVAHVQRGGKVLFEIGGAG